MSNEDDEITEEVVSSEKPQDEIIQFEQPYNTTQYQPGEFKVAFE